MTDNPTGLSVFSQLVHLELHVKNIAILNVASTLRNVESKCIKTVCLVHHCENGDYTYYRHLCLDHILSGPSYMSLTRVTVRVISNQPHWAQIWLACLHRHLPRTAERKILLFEWKFGYPRYVFSPKPVSLEGLTTPCTLWQNRDGAYQFERVQCSLQGSCDS